jgi:hypothetical protein
MRRSDWMAATKSAFVGDAGNNLLVEIRLMVDGNGAQA